MLKISVVDSRIERRLVLEGKLIAPWVAELRTSRGGERIRHQPRRRKRTLGIDE